MTIGEDRYPSVALKSVDDTVSGRIVDVADYQIKEVSGKPKSLPNGDAVMAVRIELEQTSGKRVAIWAEDERLMQAIARAFRAVGVPDVTIGDYLTVTRTGDDFEAVYTLGVRGMT